MTNSETKRWTVSVEIGLCVLVEVEACSQDEAEHLVESGTYEANFNEGAVIDIRRLGRAMEIK